MNAMKKLSDILLNVYLLPVNLAMKFGGDVWEKRFITRIMKFLKFKDIYAQVRYYPQKASQINEYQGINNDFSNCAIIIQGPVIEEDDFTLETIKLYRAYYPYARIIVSTWENCGEDFQKTIAELKVKLVKNKYPAINGVGNINYQLVSTLNGIKVAEKMNVSYIWKTRSDQRYYHPFALDFLRIKLKNSQKKIICLGGVRNSFTNRYFSLSDFMIFGSVENAKVYYSCPLDDEDSSNSKHTRKNQDQRKEYYKSFLESVMKAEINGHMSIDDEMDDASIYFRNPEIMLSYNYYCKIHDHRATEDYSYKEKYNDLLSNYIDIVDAEAIGFFWKKYELQYMCETYFDRMGKLDNIRYVVENETR